MKLYEYMAKDIFRNEGIPVPQGKIFADTAGIQSYANKLGPAVVKAQLLCGGRGKAGGIKSAETPADAEKKAQELFFSKIKGYKVDKVLVEEKLKIEQEIYLAITVDSSGKQPLVLASRHGGMDIENVPDEHLLKKPLDISLGLHPSVAENIAGHLDLTGKIAQQAVDLLLKLYSIFRSYDAELVEINPLVITGGRLIAADGKLTLDDDAAYRYQADISLVREYSPREARAQALGISYVELDGDIAVMANGAGITMATLDIIQHYGGRARNFMDAGGGASTEATAKALEILLSTHPQALLINIFGGITRCDEVAAAFIQVKNSLDISIPVVIRLAGTNAEKGIALLRQEGIVCYEEIDSAVLKAIESAGENRGG